LHQAPVLRQPDLDTAAEPAEPQEVVLTVNRMMELLEVVEMIRYLGPLVVTMGRAAEAEARIPTHGLLREPAAVAVVVVMQMVTKRTMVQAGAPEADMAEEEAEEEAEEATATSAVQEDQVEILISMAEEAEAPTTLLPVHLEARQEMRGREPTEVSLVQEQLVVVEEEAI
jgi:hypothetical protein